ncbi:unnamed protein product [Agarophyton chilense]
MARAKFAKNKAYLKRYQTKFRRRREGKTDYQARRRLITQDKRKYNSPKYRLVVRFTNRDIICQIVAARLAGDEVLTAAYAHELPRYGIKHGLTNFSAAYCVGLLCARRHLKKLGLDETYVGVEEVDGEMFEIEEDEDRRPFTALLDIGLVNTSTGNKVFAVMKGAVDGGMDIPHNEKRFPAYSKEEGFDAEMLKSRILGNHISEYMEYLLEEDEDAYQKQFSKYVADGVEAEGIEDMYLEAHKKIREDPVFAKKDKPDGVKHNTTWRLPKRTKAERQQAIKEKLTAVLAAAAAGDQ